MTSDSKRSYAWTSFGQLAALDYAAAPALQNLAGVQIYAAAQVKTDFAFDAGGNRSHQLKQRIASDGTVKLEKTAYLGSYERELHQTKATATADPVSVRTVHRHSIGGFAVYTRSVAASGVATIKLTTILKDHLGSTDVLYTGTWNGSTFANATDERQSFDAWGERRDPASLAAYRATDGDAFRTSAQDYDRGYTGHEQLDDSGLIHMNGRLYDPELGRMLSPDPFVQVPEFSQNFNRYSYVLNNPLNLTDPTGFSFVGDLFKDVGGWLNEQWKTVVVIVVRVVVTIAVTIVSGGNAQLGNAVGSAVAAGLSSALHGGSFGDVLLASSVAFAESYLGNYVDEYAGSELARAAGHGVVGGASNAAMGGKFQDGFITAASSSALYSAADYSGISKIGPGVTKTVIGGTVSVIGGGKFANGAWTSAFDYLLSDSANRYFTQARTQKRYVSDGAVLTMGTTWTFLGTFTGAGVAAATSGIAYVAGCFAIGAVVGSHVGQQIGGALPTPEEVAAGIGPGIRGAGTPNQCVPYSKALSKALTRSGIRHSIIIYDSQRDSSVGPYIVADYGILPGRIVSANGHHEGVMVGNTIYDNNAPSGVPFAMWTGLQHQADFKNGNDNPIIHYYSQGRATMTIFPR